jgi:hypothetical protein
MGRFVNNTTKVIVSVDDGKDGRFTSGWTELEDGQYEAGSDAADGAPKGNASRDEWASYADSQGVTYDDDAKREDIKAAVDAARSGD